MTRSNILGSTEVERYNDVVCEGEHAIVGRKLNPRFLVGYKVRNNKTSDEGRVIGVYAGNDGKYIRFKVRIVDHAMNTKLGTESYWIIESCSVMVDINVYKDLSDLVA